MRKLLIILFPAFILFACSSKGTNNTNKNNNTSETEVQNTTIYPGIYDTESYISLTKNKKIGVVANQTSIIDNTHLVDTLLTLEQNVIKVFCPEHGFRGTEDAGASIDNSIDSQTGLPIISLYGNNKKPHDEQVSDLDIIIFDLQDVGVRFYTYISTLHYVMESCAENNIPLIVLDRPNPNANIIDGAILDTANYRSFIGMHPVPIAYGMTIGEYAGMINGENWLANGVQCDLTVIKCKNYDHNKKYSLPVRPSPNLPNDRSIELYPTLCLFESTNLSIGRGTSTQFQIIGHPYLSAIPQASFTFTPQPNEGASNPKLKGELCYGFDLTQDYSIFDWESNKINISLIIELYKMFPNKEEFFKTSNSIELLSGYKEFRTQITDQLSEEEIRNGWEEGLNEFKEIRKKYLLYD